MRTKLRYAKYWQTGGCFLPTYHEISCQGHTGTANHNWRKPILNRNKRSIMANDNSGSTTVATLSEIATVVLEHCVISYGDPSYILAYVGLSLLVNSLKRYGFPRTNNASNNHLSTLEGWFGEQSSYTLLHRLIHYVVEHYRNWELCTQSLTNIVKTKMPLGTLLILCTVIVPQTPPIAATFEGLTEIQTRIIANTLQ